MPSDETDDRTDAQQDDGTGADGKQATSPALEHLDETMKRARQAADEALAPQRE